MSKLIPAIEESLFVSIFVPVYNGEKYLEQTLKSIQQQTYTNFEVLLVDDSSTDGSLPILNQFANNDDRFKVFTKENGGMVAPSMNFILPKISGDYFFYSSQDDIFSKDLIEKMVLKHHESGADCILPDMEFYFENKQNNKQIIGFNGDRTVVLSGKEACVASLNWSIHGFALFKSSLVKSEFVPEDAFDSDEYVTRKLFFKSRKIVFSTGMFFYRQDNANAITKTFSKKNFYRLNSSWKLFEFLKNNNFEKKIVYTGQLHIVQEYLNTFSLFEFFKFKSEKDKNEIELFLINFKKSHLVNEFFYHEIGFLFKKLKLRYLILVLVLKSPFLFRIFMKYKRVKLKNSKFIKNFSGNES